MTNARGLKKRTVLGRFEFFLGESCNLEKILIVFI